MSLRARLSLTPEPLYLMDGSAFVFRGFYAFQNMSRSDGFPTNALYIVARIMLKLLREERPNYFAFVLDGKGKNFRHERFPAYKAQRSSTPEPLVKQLEPILRFMGILGVPVLVSENCEADDCIASLAARFREERPVVMVGADKDLKQCLHRNVLLWDPASKEEKVTTLADFEEETGFAPASWPDYQALVGDSSDNIPGVPKIGPKTAVGLIQEFPHLEELFDRLAAVPPKVRTKLEGQRENALLYRELTTLLTDSCQSSDLESVTVQPPDLSALLSFMAEFELRTLTKEVESMDRAGLFNRSALVAGALGGQNEASLARSGAKKTPASTRESKAGASEDKERAQASLFSEKAPGASSASGASPSGVAGQAMSQGSLFAAAPAGGLRDIPVAAAVNSLPFWAGNGGQEGSGAEAILALLPSPGGADGLLIAGGGNTEGTTAWEYVYTGPVDALATALNQYAQPQQNCTLVAPDCKLLYKTHPELRSLPEQCWFDLSLAAYLLSPEDRGYNWEQVSVRWGEQSGSAYAANEHPGLLALDIFSLLRSRLAGTELTQVFTSMEMPLVPVLARMEDRGITVDKQAFAGFLDEVLKELDRLTDAIHSLAGRSFNIRSSQQLGDVLFSVLDLPKAGKTRGGAASTSQEALEKLSGKHPIIEAILDYRKLEKLRSTYLEPLPLLADAQGRIHTTFNQTATATGRLSSSNPNLQNIPIRGAFGERMRSCFIAAPEKALVCADYSQIELRVLAHLSGDQTLLDAFHKNEDIHARTAGLLYDVALGEVTPDQRRNAKTINFGLVYGMGAQRLAQELHISMKEAKEFIERYFSRLTRLKEFYDAIEEDAKGHGFVSTMAGRRRFTPEILSQNNQLRSQARRQAINARIQGSAADIIKLAMIAVENDPQLQSLQASLLLQIHDELVLEAPSANAGAAGKRLAELMGGVQPGGQALSVPLLVDWGTGHTWSEAH